MNLPKKDPDLPGFRFLDGLDHDLKQALLFQLKVLWTYHSNAIEGNTLTLGDTQFILEEGLTIAGKSLREHNEVVGHARAIDLLYGMVSSEYFSKDDLFLLHKAIQTDLVVDYYMPVGQWKNEINGRNLLINNKLQFIEYPHPKAIAHLMEIWLIFFNSLPPSNDLEILIEQYAALHISFTEIHPFSDGNGRLARLVANIPLLRAGYPPITIEKEKRQNYIDILKEYALTTPQLDENSTEIIENENESFKSFITFCKQEYQLIEEQIKSITQIQKKRDNNRNASSKKSA